MGKFSDKARKIDMYASLPRLSFGKDGKVYSRFGLLLTLLTIIIVGGMAIWIGIKIFGRQKPAFVQYDLPPKEFSPQIPFNTDDFKFGISLNHPDEDMYVSRMTVYYDLVGDRIIPLTEKKCQFEIAAGQDFTCFEQAENTKGETYLDLKGNWKYMMMYYYCVDPTKNCHTPPETKIWLDQAPDATLMFEDLLIDPFDYENPITTTTSFVTQPPYLSVGTTLVIELNEVEFISDNGWLFEDKKTITRFKPTVTKEISKSEMLGLQLKYGGTKTVYKRSYPKIQDFLAQISGFITIITPTFLILVSPYGNLQAIQHMTNELYEIKLNKPNNNNNNGGDSPQKPLTKKRKSSKLKVSPTLTKENEGDLLPQKTIAKFKTRGQSLSTNRTKTLTSPHAVLVMGSMGKTPAKELPAPKENNMTFQFDTFDKSATDVFGSASRTPPYEASSNLISPQKPPVEYSKAQLLEEQKPEALQVKDLENSNIDNQNPDEVSDCETDVPLRTSDPLEVPWQTWLKSFWKPNPEVQVLKKAREHLMEAFDLVTLSKKVTEIDKLKACLFTRDQRVIFENLPSSVIVLNPDIDLKSPEAIQQYHWKDSFKGDEVALRKAYLRLKETQSQLDQLLLRLYESEYIDDGFRQEE